MIVSKKKIIWSVLSIIMSCIVGYESYQHPATLKPLIDLLATVISILIGISLAISAVLSNRPNISNRNYVSETERTQIERIIKQDDRLLIDGQNFIFWLYYVTLIFALLFKWINVQETDLENSKTHIKVIASALGFIATLALLWSATLPSLLRSINLQRKDLV